MFWISLCFHIIGNILFFYQWYSGALRPESQYSAYIQQHVDSSINRGLLLSASLRSSVYVYLENKIDSYYSVNDYIPYKISGDRVILSTALNTTNYCKVLWKYASKHPSKAARYSSVGIMVDVLFDCTVKRPIVRPPPKVPAMEIPFFPQD